MKTVLMIVPTPFFADRGCHVRIYEEAKSIEKLGNKVLICTYHHGRNITDMEIYRIINIPWYKKFEAGPSLHKIYLDILLFLKTLSVAIRKKPEVIHAHLHEGVLIGYFVSKISNIPLIADLQGSLTTEMEDHVFFQNKRFLYPFFRWIERKINDMPNIIMVSSQEAREKIKEESKLHEEKVIHIPDGVDTNEFRPDLDVSDLKIKMNLPEDKKIVVYLGLLNEYQGVDCLVKSIPLVLKNVKEVHFLIMGYPDVEKYKKMAKKLGISDNVTFTGRIDYKEAPRYILLGNVAISPKLSETEANGKVYNYIACGLPTVAFDTTVNREILGDFGVYARKLGDPVSLAEAIERILVDEKLAKDLSIKVRKRAVDNFPWDNVAKRLINCYEVILMGGKKDD